MEIRSLFFVQLLLLHISPAQAVPRPPTDRWIVSFDDSQCVAQRNYGTKEKPVHLILKQPPLGEVMQLAVVEDRGAGNPVQYEGSIRFDNLPPLKLNVLKFEPKNANVRTYLFNVPLTDFVAFRSAKSVAFSARGLSEEFALSGAEPLLKVMDNCIADLRQVWNVAVSGLETTASIAGPQGSLAKVFSPDDYPPAAMDSMQGGTVRVTVLIDEQGKVADCSIVETSTSASLDGQTCAVIRERARFKPAKDASGKAVKGAFQQRITWQIQ